MSSFFASVPAVQQGVAYITVTHGVLHQIAIRNKCPVALLHTLLAIDALDVILPIRPRTKDVSSVMHLSLPLVRGYLRDLEARQYLERRHPSMERGEHVIVFKRAARELRLTYTGNNLIRECHHELRESVTKLLAVDFKFLGQGTWSL